MSWRDNLRPARWRNCRFEARTAESNFGRRTALHEYPFRDSVWVEDLGRSVRRLFVTGYIHGDDVLEQKEQLIAAAEESGLGSLVHPTLGTLKVSLVGFVTAERWELGRVVELSFAFIEAGEPSFPDTEDDTQAEVETGCQELQQASQGDFITDARNALKQGSEIVKEAVTTAKRWASTADQLVQSASMTVNSVGSLIPGSGKVLSRFNRGMRSVRAPLRSINAGLRRVSTARVAVTNAGANLAGIAARLGL